MNGPDPWFRQAVVRPSRPRFLISDAVVVPQSEGKFPLFEDFGFRSGERWAGWLDDRGEDPSFVAPLTFSSRPN